MLLFSPTDRWKNREQNYYFLKQDEVSIAERNDQEDKCVLSDINIIKQLLVTGQRQRGTFLRFIDDLYTRFIYEIYIRDLYTRFIYEIYIRDLYTRFIHEIYICL